MFIVGYVFFTCVLLAVLPTVHRLMTFVEWSINNWYVFIVSAILALLVSNFSRRGKKEEG